MQVHKSIKELPWPEMHQGPERSQFTVRGTWRVIDHERMLVLTFTANREHHGYGDFRIMLSKKRRDFASWWRNDPRVVAKVLNDFLSPMHTAASYCYPEIDQRTEQWIEGVTGEKCHNHQMAALQSWMKDILTERREAARRAAGEIEDEAVYACPEALPAGLADWIWREVLPNDETAIYKKGGTRGTCQACGSPLQKHGQERMRQGAYTHCPACGQKRLVCILATGESWRSDKVINVAAAQPGEGGTVWFRVWHLRRDATRRYEKGVERYLEEVARYAVRGRKVAMWTHEGKETCYTRTVTYRRNDWERIRRFYIYDGHYKLFPGGIAEAVTGSSLQYAQLDRYAARTYVGGNRTCPISYAADFVRYPVMEFLWKAGYHCLLSAKNRGMTKEQRNAMLWQRDKLAECFRFPPRLLKLKEPGKWTMYDVRRMNQIWALGKSEKEKAEIFTTDFPLSCQAALDYAAPRKIMSYLGGQTEAYGTVGTVAGDYRDYLTECRTLGLDMTDKAVLFPRNLREAHHRTSSMVKHKLDKEKRKMLRARAAALEKWAWEQGGVLIRPAKSLKELTAEGSALHHCVGGYAERMAKGETAIFLIRQAESPGQPWFTLELREGRVIQCRGKSNRSYTENAPVKAFVDEWFNTVVHAKKKKSKKKEAA